MSFDPQKFRRQTFIRLAIGGLILLFVVGTGLIYWQYGPASAGFGILCMLGGLVPIGLVIFFLWGIDWIVKRNRDG
jgi:hypothetical protein